MRLAFSSLLLACHFGAAAADHYPNASDQSPHGPEVIAYEEAAMKLVLANICLAEFGEQPGFGGRAVFDQSFAELLVANEALPELAPLDEFYTMRDRMLAETVPDPEMADNFFLIGFCEMLAAEG